MTFYRFIERTSIRHNPRAGSTMSYVVAHREARLRVSCECPSDFVQPEGVVSGACDENFCEFWWMLTDEDATVKLTAVLNQFPSGVSRELNFRQDVVPIAHPPAPPYLFDWAPCTVRCHACGHIFDAYELESDSSDAGFSDELCPACGQWECCDLQLEEMSPVEMAKWADKNDQPKHDQEG